MDGTSTGKSSPLLDQALFNMAIADLYSRASASGPGVLYTAGVQHAGRTSPPPSGSSGINAKAVSGETPKRELSTRWPPRTRRSRRVSGNAQLLAEGLELAPGHHLHRP